MPRTFKPTGEARAAFERMRLDTFGAAMKQFFDLWDAEGDSHRAGSLAAHALMTCAARIAVFGAQCAGVEPQREMWLAACDAAYAEAVETVEKSFDIAGAEFKKE